MSLDRGKQLGLSYPRALVSACERKIDIRAVNTYLVGEQRAAVNGVAFFYVVGFASVRSIACLCSCVAVIAVAELVE